MSGSKNIICQNIRVSENSKVKEIDDHSGDVVALRALLLENGVKMSELTAGLTPIYYIVWRDIALGYIGLLASQLLIIYLSDLPTGTVVLSVFLGAVLTGFFMAYLQLFTHEAAHRNIARTPDRNDKLANAILTVWLGQDIGEYRRVHLKHHRGLGTPDDPERSYFYQPTAKFLFETLFLVHLFRVFLTHHDLREKRNAKWKLISKHLVGGLLLNASVVFGLLWAAGIPSAISWIMGMLCFFPFFSTWRQLLEHRSPKAKASIDYEKIEHGAYTRIFGNTLLERLFGGAGFNSHLLHHWAPEVSYTRFGDLKQRLSELFELNEIISSRQSDYLHTLKLLINKKSP